MSISAYEPHEILILRFVRCYISDVFTADSISVPYLLAIREVKIITETSQRGESEIFSKHRQVALLRFVSFVRNGVERFYIFV